jgi:hypothetical protein
MLLHLTLSITGTVTELETDIRKWINEWNKDPGPSSGPRPPTRSWKPSPPTVNELLGQNTSHSSALRPTRNKRWHFRTSRSRTFLAWTRVLMEVTKVPARIR